MKRVLLVLSAAAIVAATMAVNALPAFAQQPPPPPPPPPKAGPGQLPDKAAEKVPEEKKELPKTGGWSGVPLAAVAMLVGTGVIGYAVLRSRRGR